MDEQIKKPYYNEFMSYADCIKVYEREATTFAMCILLEEKGDLNNGQ